MNEELLETLPPDLDNVADMWREHITKYITVTMTHDVSKHIEGTYSTYVMTITCEGGEVLRVVYYAGQSTRPRNRATEHKSEFKSCRPTIRIGKSRLYSAKFLSGVNAVKMHLEVYQSGFTKEGIKKAEEALSVELERLYGSEAVLTRPKGKNFRAD